MITCGTVARLATPCHRVNFTKYYNLPERVFPKDVRDVRLTDQEQIDWLCEAALDRMGFGTLGEVRKFWEAMDPEEVRAWSENASATLQEVEIETVPRESG